MIIIIGLSLSVLVDLACVIEILILILFLGSLIETIPIMLE